MTRMRKYFNTKGLTLIEILASIVMLGIILSAFFAFFSQSMMFSSKVEDKFSGVNTAEKVMYDVKSSNEVKEIISSCKNDSLAELKGKEIQLNKSYDVNNKPYYPKITIYQSSDEKKLCLYRVHVEIYDGELGNLNSKLLSELFDYIDYDDIKD